PGRAPVRCAPRDPMSHPVARTYVRPPTYRTIDREPTGRGSPRQGGYPAGAACLRRAPVPIRIANAPVSFGVFEMTNDRPDTPGGAAVAGMIAETGYAGTELGPPGLFGTGAEVGALLAEHGLALVAAYVPLHLADRAQRDDDTAALDAVLDD